MFFCCCSESVMNCFKFWNTKKVLQVLSPIMNQHNTSAHFLSARVRIMCVLLLLYNTKLEQKSKWHACEDPQKSQPSGEETDKFCIFSGS